MNIFNTTSEFFSTENLSEIAQGSREYYFEKENIKVHFYNNCVTIYDLTKAFKSGESNYISISLGYGKKQERSQECVDVFIWMCETGLMNNLDAFKAETFKSERNKYIDLGDVRVVWNPTKNKTIYSPFAKHQKALKAVKTLNLGVTASGRAKRLTRNNLLGMILNEQIVSGTREMYTDDYAYDAASNCSEKVFNTQDVIKHITESDLKDYYTDKNEFSICRGFSYNIHFSIADQSIK